LTDLLFRFSEGVRFKGFDLSKEACSEEGARAEDATAEDAGAEDAGAEDAGAEDARAEGATDESCCASWPGAASTTPSAGAPSFSVLVGRTRR